MARYQTSIPSSLSVEQAFSYLADFSSTQEWDPGVVVARRVDEGPVTVGSRVALTAKFARRGVPLVYEVRELQAPSKVVHVAESRLFRSIDTVSVIPHGEGSLVNYDARLECRGLFVLAAPLVALTFRRVGERARSGLARALNP